VFLRRFLLLIIVLIVVSACGGAPTPQNSGSPTTLLASSAPTAATVPTMPTAPTTLIAPTQAVATSTHTGIAKKIDVGGRSLYLLCIGTGSPPVILEGGAGGNDGLGRILLGVKEITRVCEYDRAGLGQSDPVAGPLSAHQFVQDVNTLLKNAGVTGPYVLFG
jgi:pimeloyl-ACP methyl ester carboxylesterase